VGSAPDEADDLVTGIVNHQVLKRLTRVQNFNYSIDLPQQDALTLGRSKPFSRRVNEPPAINVSFSYLLNGVDNERRIGLNTGLSQCLTHDILTSRTKDARNIYLTVNSQEEDMHSGATWPHGSELESYEHTESEIGDSSATGYSVVAFQNCYLNSYSLDISPGSLPAVSLSYAADNMNAYASGSGIYVPHLDLKDGKVTNKITDAYISDFVTDTDNWDAQNVVTDIVDVVDGVPNPLEIQVGDDDDETHYIERDTAFLTIGKKYKITGWGRLHSSASFDSIRFYDGNTSTESVYNIGDAVTQQLGTWQYFSLEFTAQTNYIQIYLIMTGAPEEGTKWSGNTTTDVAWLKDIVISEITDARKFIIPKSFKDDPNYTSDFTKDYRRTVVTVSNAGVSGVTGFLNDEITECSVGFSIARDDIAFVGHKLISERKPKIPMMSDLSFGIMAKENITGSFLGNMKENENYNVTIDLKDKDDSTLSKYIFSGAKFEGISYDSSIGSNKTASLKFSNYMDLENPTEGVFVSGKITSAISGSSTIYPQF
jgi:hypothetical protein